VPPAEYGQGSSAINMVTRSGTNRFHGSLYEYYRGTVMQALDPSTRWARSPINEASHRGSLAGPLRLPHYDGRNRTFFFFNFEAGRLWDDATRVASVPLDTFWRGDFSALLARGIQLRDPLLTGKPVVPGNRPGPVPRGARISPLP